MLPSIALLVALAASFTGLAHAESAADLPRAELLGGGDAATDCLSTLDVVGHALRSGSRSVRCEDGDPLCDRDRLVNGRCEWWVRTCFNRTTDPRCDAAGVTSVAVDDSADDTDLTMLARTHAPLSLPTAETTCSALTTLTVSLGTRANGSPRKARKTIAWRTTGDGLTDDDRIRFDCVPPAKERRKSGISFRTIERRVFRKQCAFSGCHAATNPAAGLPLVGDAAYDALVDQRASASAAAFAGKKRVVPGAPDTSFLMDKLEAKLGPGEGDAMPQARAPLAANEIAAIRKWIRAGAPRDRVIGGGVLGNTDEQPRIPTPAVPDGGHQAHMSPFPMGDHPEIEGCQMVRLENPDDMFVQGWELFMHEGSHHFILRAHRCTDADADGTNDCDEEDFDARFPSGFAPCEQFGTGWGFVVGAQTPHYLVDYQTAETGVAVQLHKRQPLLLNSHYTNPYSDTRAEVWVNVRPVDAALVRHPARILFDTLASAFIKVAPGKAATFQADACAFADSALCDTAGMPKPIAPWFALLGVTSHMHKRSLKFLADLHALDGSRIERPDDMTDADDGSKHLYVSHDYADPISLPFWPPIVVQRGQRLAYSCYQDNGVDTPVRLGCEETPGVPPGQSIFEAFLAGGDPYKGAAKWCRTDADCTGVGTGRCVPAHLVFGELADDEMCILPGLYYGCGETPESCAE